PTDPMATTTPPTGPADKVCESYTPTTRQLSGEVSWSKPGKIALPDIFAAPNEQNGNAYTSQNSVFYTVGVVKSGKYKGYDVVLADMALEGPAFYPIYYHFLKKGDAVVLLAKNSGSFVDSPDDQTFNKSKVTIDSAYAIADLNYLEQFRGMNAKEVFKKNQYDTFEFCGDGLRKVFSDGVLGDVYTTGTDGANGGKDFARGTSSYGFYLAAPDGTAISYQLVIDFVGTDNVPHLTWSDGTANTAEYKYTDIGGCGSVNYLSVMAPDKIDRANDLVKAGKNSFGEDIYVLKDMNHPVLRDIYDNQYFVYQGEKVSYDEFTKSWPVFFWIDPFGDLVKFQNAKFVPLAECGKPVIYLYPQTREQVSVRLAPQDGFSYTEPEYGTGWDVIADPSGVLVNVSDGKSYPYLFWEGRGGMYQEPTKGFVVAENEVHSFLQEKLALLGLNAKESADFEEFWEPRMKGAPYYFISFLGNSVMDQLAPLSITPAPDTVIRVLMDFRPLQAPVASTGYHMKTPVRRGFTVVEWGGVLR
ncbi:MAG TPA: hypothetical protein VJK50_05355, partial [Patescibacteria group bacterium]|nr:hypothetical protein [Patescibacteria group bacterium]